MATPATLIRWLLFALLAAVVGGAALLLMLTVDTGLSIWQRLQGLPVGFRYLYIALLGAAATLIAWLGWKLLRRGRKHRRLPAPPPLTRERLQQRSDSVADPQLRSVVEAELAEFDRRADSEQLHVALFGAINAGKSALIRAMVPGAALDSDVLGGTTRTVSQYQGRLPDGRRIVLADVPGTQEDPGRERLAREEVLRAHWVLYVCAGDLSRAEAIEVDWLDRFDKPFALVLNQVDRYDAGEVAQLRKRLHERTGVEVVAVSAGGDEEVVVADADGERRTWRPRPAQIESLLRLLERELRGGIAAFEPARTTAVLQGLDLRVSEQQARERAERADAVVVKYTRRAVVGALAAVAPGSDLVIQGALGTALVRELAGIYDSQVRQIDIDALIERVGRTLRTSTAVVLAIAGNAAKAFPGLGTIGGGLAHAVAYGLIFDSLGRAVAATLADGAPLDPERTAQVFAERVAQAPAGRVLGLLHGVLGSGHAGRGEQEKQKNDLAQ